MKKIIMRLLVVFVFFFGVVSCDNRKDAPKCEEIEGVNGFASKKGDFSLPRDCDDQHSRVNYPTYNKYKNYTGIIKNCNKNKVSEYGSYKNGKLNGKKYRYSIDNIGNFNDFSFINLFKLFRKPKLTSLETYKNGECIHYMNFDYFNGNKSYESISVVDKIRDFCSETTRAYYENGQLGYEMITKYQGGSPKNITTYWDKKGKKTTQSEYHTIKFTKRDIFDFVGITITPLSLFIIFILYRRRQKNKTV